MMMRLPNDDLTYFIPLNAFDVLLFYAIFFVWYSVVNGLWWYQKNDKVELCFFICLLCFMSLYRLLLSREIISIYS